MPHGRARTALTLVFVVIAIVGVALIYLPVTKSFPISANQEKLLCNNVLSATVAPHKPYQFPACYVESHGWVQVSVSSAGSSATYLLSFSPLGSSGSKVVTTGSGLQFSTTFPVSVNGTLTLQVQNPSNATIRLGGTFVSATQVHVADAYQLTKYPYRYEGVAAVLISAIVVFLLVWNPRRIGTRTLDFLLGPS